MKRTAATLALSCSIFGAAAAYGQAQFEVASVKAAPPSEDPTHLHSRMSVDDNRLLYANVTVADVLEQAYKIQRNQITGPAWIDQDRFDITGKIPAGQRDQAPQMLRALLAERFHMAVHQESRELPVYSLTVTKGGPKFNPADSSNFAINHGRYKTHVDLKGSMARFVDYLSTEAGRPVIDKTGLAGSYDLSLEWTSDEAADSVSIFTALQDQLGLKLEPGKGPVEVVDRADRVPVEN